MPAGAQTSTAPAEQLARHQRAGAVVGQELEQHRVRHLAVEDHHTFDAGFERVDAGLDLGGHAGRKSSPMKTWKDKKAFDETARKFVRMFQENFVKFEQHVDVDVRSAAPEVRIAAE